MSTKKGKQQKGKEPYVEKSKNIKQARSAYITHFDDLIHEYERENKLIKERGDEIFEEFQTNILKINNHSELEPFYKRCKETLEKEIIVTTPSSTPKKVIIPQHKYEKYLKHPHTDDEGNPYYLDDYNEPLYTTSKMNYIILIKMVNIYIYVDEDENGETYYANENN